LGSEYSHILSSRLTEAENGLDGAWRQDRMIKEAHNGRERKPYGKYRLGRKTEEVVMPIRNRCQGKPRDRSQPTEGKGLGAIGNRSRGMLCGQETTIPHVTRVSLMVVKKRRDYMWHKLMILTLGCLLAGCASLCAKRAFYVSESNTSYISRQDEIFHEFTTSENPAMKARTSYILSELWRNGVLKDSIKDALADRYYKVVLLQVYGNYQAPNFVVQCQQSFPFPSTWTEFTPILYKNEDSCKTRNYLRNNDLYHYFSCNLLQVWFNVSDLMANS
jgi:hypothetical protein